MSIGTDIGKRIKRYRQKQNMTLKEIEARVSISATHVSEIERGKTSPTINALCKIARALDVDPALFLAHDELPPVRIIRREERDSVRFEPGGFRVEPLSSSVPQQELSSAICHWGPNMSHAPVRQHVGEEFGYILEGTLEVTAGEEVFTLREGDTIHFRANTPHLIVNRSDQTCRGIWVTLPKFGL